MQELSDHLHSLVLSPSFVSVPSTEEGYVSLHQQTGDTVAIDNLIPSSERTRPEIESRTISGLHDDDSALPQTSGSDNWRSKAIRRKLSRLKELVLFVGGLPVNLEKTDYVKRLSLYNNKREDASIGPVFPDQGCVFISFTSGMAAASMVKALHDRKIFGRTPTLIFLPYITMPTGSPVSDPLLIFINSKSGGGKGKQLVEMMRGILNKNQVFLLELGGPMPGLYAFRKLSRFRILVCGGDGTVGWVLSALEQILKYIECKSPPIAVLPLGTGNDLARVLGFGSGWSGEAVANVLHQVHEARPVKMNRWTIFFDTSPAQNREPVEWDADRLDSILEDPVCDNRKVDTMVNGHKILQRNCKYNPQRSRINIVMGDDDTVWQTADKFNKSPEEEKPEFSDWRESNRTSNSEGDTSDAVSLHKKETAADLKPKCPAHVEDNSEARVLSSDILDKMTSPPPSSSDGKGDIFTMIKKVNEKLCDAENTTESSNLLDKTASSPLDSGDCKGDTTSMLENSCDTKNAAETPVQTEVEDGIFSEKTTVKTTFADTVVLEDFELKAPEEGSKRFVDFKTSGSENDKSSEARKNIEDGVAEAAVGKEDGNSSGKIAKRLSCEEAFEFKASGVGSKPFADFESLGSQIDENLEHQKNKSDVAKTPVQNEAKDGKYCEKVTKLPACDEATVKTTAEGADVCELQDFEFKALEDSDRFSGFDSSSANDEKLGIQKNEDDVTEMQVRSTARARKYREETTEHSACGNDTIQSEQFADSASSTSEKDKKSAIQKKNVAVAGKKNEAGVADIRRKTVHRKLQILSSSDILGSQDSGFQPYRQLAILSAKCDETVSEEELENAEKCIESVPDDIILKQGAVDDLVNEILQSELPDIINDKQKLLALLTCDNTQSELNKMIEESKQQEEKAEGTANLSSTENENEGKSLQELETQSASYVDAYVGESSSSSRMRSQTTALGRHDYFGPRKKMSMPLITMDRTYKEPGTSLTEIAEDTIDRPAKVTRQNNVHYQRSISDISREEAAKTTASPKVVTMNNYFGLGVDAELSLYFHLAREENPEKFSSRLHNKAVYLKAGLKKMTSRSMQLNHIIDLEVDGVNIPLPSVKGLIFLNISSWGSGANAWGSSTSRRFQTPSFGDGLLEVIGVGGIAHMSQMYSGIRGGIRIAQGEYIRLRLNAAVAVQVDGEPWMQPPGRIAITVSPLQVMMLKRQKKRAR